MLSINRETFGRRRCAASVSRAIRAGVLSSLDLKLFTTSTPSVFIAPAGISSPYLFITGKASPVMC